jgi:8-oxo-dGTP pyrophosphatase MutT (NUDIX family)
VDSNGPHVVVSAMLLDSEGRIFLGRSPKWHDQWTIPGGKVRVGERLLDALQREVKEETGIAIIDATPFRVSESIYDQNFRDGTWHFIFIDFLCMNFIPNIQVDNKEIVEFCWVPVEAASALPLSSATRATIEQFVSSRADPCTKSTSTL